MPPTYDYYDPEGVLAADIFGGRGCCPTKSALLSYIAAWQKFFLFFLFQAAASIQANSGSTPIHSSINTQPCFTTRTLNTFHGDGKFESKSNTESRRITVEPI